ncbi:MAG: hypothetical protein AMJ79_04635 [Phycisphaerae bacterium SM23_30]|nr:MAG: hypothetical protein AMJ79_04635 [Phycisphaerae bacterium SM23_30]
MKLSARRAELLSLAALLLQALFFLLTLFISYRTGSPAVRVEAWHFLGGTGIWLILLLQFHQRRMAEEERLDAEQYRRLHREGKDTSVFEGKMIEEELHVAGRRLVWLEKYLLAVFGVFISVYHLAMGIWLYIGLTPTDAEAAGQAAGRASELAPGEVLLSAAAFLVGMALVSFLISRYAVGMSQRAEWRPLRAGGSYLLSNVLACLSLAVILGFAKFGYRLPEQVTAYVLVALMAVIGLEIILSLLLDAFRPRIKGQYRRAAYESRLLGLFSEPGGILRTAAHAIDYQFGFKVSETWFYKLIERAVVPLLLAMAFSLYMLSSLSVVPPGSVGVLERWGRPLNVDSPYQSGLHLKFPWPIDTIRKFPVDKVHIIEVGFERFDPKLDDRGRPIPDKTPILWTKEHWKDEYPFMVAVSEDEGATGLEFALGEQQPALATEIAALPEEQEATAKSEFEYENFDILVVALVMHYRIKDVAQYGYGRDYCYQDPHELLQSICDRQVVHYAAHSDIDKLLGPGRYETTQALWGKIQAEADQRRMGVEIVFVGLESVHPPIKGPYGSDKGVAEAFEDVIGAHQERQALVLMAQGEAQEKLARAEGESNILLSQARAYAFERPTVEKARAERFTQQLLAFSKGQQVYLLREFLSVLDNNVPKMRKYMIVSDKVGHLVLEIDLEERLEPDLFSDILYRAETGDKTGPEAIRNRRP